MTVRERLKDDLEARYDKLLAMLDEGMTATRSVRVQRRCSKCACQHIEFVEVPNTDAALKVAEFFANQGFGRPAQAEADAQESFSFENRVVLVAEDV